MQNNKQLITALVSGLRQDIKDYSQLTQMLQQQQQYMLKNNAQALIVLQPKTDILLQRLLQSTALRHKYLQQLGFEASSVGMQRLLKALPNGISSKIDPIWEKLVQSVTDSKVINNANGNLLAIQRDIFEHSFNKSQDCDYGRLTQGI